MRFIVSSQYFLKQLSLLNGIIGNTVSRPILSCFLFELDQNILNVSASDMETYLTAGVEVESEFTGKIAVPAKLLLETLRTFSEQPLTFVIEDSFKLVISSSHGNYTLAWQNPHDFPKPIELPEVDSFDITADTLATAISQTIFAAADDDLNPAVSGVLFDLKPGKFVTVGTNAHKLVKYERSDIKIEKESQFIVSKKPLSLLKGTLAGSESIVKVNHSSNNASFIYDNVKLTCQLIEGEYPNYDGVIPLDNPNILTIDRQQFLNSVRRVSIFSSKSSFQVTLNLAGAELLITAEDIDFNNSARERLTCDYRGDDLEITFNSRLLIEMLNNLDSETALLSMSLPDRASILTALDGLDPGEKITMLVMPVMITHESEEDGEFDEMPSL